MIKRNVQGWIPDRPDHRDLVFKVDLRPTLPSFFDGEFDCPRVEDQGNLGSCVGHAWTSAGEYLAKKLNLEPKNFSRLHSYYYARKQGGFPTDADTGAYVRDGAKVHTKLGFCPERFWGYDVARFRQEPPPEAQKAALRHQVTAYSRCPGMQAIKRAIAAGLPVVGGFSVSESIYSNETETTGVIAFPQPGEAIVGGHAVMFMGFDNSKRLLKFQNSWGRQWGKDGFGYLPYRYVREKLASDFWTISDQEGRPAMSVEGRVKRHPEK